MAIDFLIGRKMGMTRVFDDNIGLDFPVTILQAGPCFVTQIKTAEKDSYSSVQLGFQNKSDRHVKKSENGHFKKAGIPAKNIIKEVITEDVEGINIGQNFCVDIFEMGDLVTVSGISKGKGFTGHMKRHGFSGGRRSHGKNSVMRKAGSVGAGTDPSRIWPGTRMAGRMGHEKVSVKNLEIVRVVKDNNQLFIKGAVPGAKQGIVYITKQ
jgi:large subunit ribosomal protein L3